ncbi:MULTISPECIES: hypothetical protein [unclassified Tolypothrix]|uniref:hypothetical protein n=1 Tax=unclassified Tolypothrix TaxID=2649714 RepID=UPI0005EABA99|nr:MULTISPECIES: hypothetical protein [unclassified Tolypothrix]EKF03202.1 hypothetical protein FDUTEX481_05483 [Tolypothrix sp. PCC 7601]MBE9086520.1 hypothetical protein [Tolypothrix sp. LEGE 11397]UYD29533.1 hypothetical protein HGR01_16820 [Tolypothrix sp. PCC 7712]UYD34555.1 hypothetical protein HG267_01480 [Tolypothrix sp. PCC 7601]
MGDQNCTPTKKAPADGLRFNRAIALPDSPIFLQPAAQSTDGNNVLELQLDLGS